MTGLHALMDKLLPFEIFSFGFMKNALLALLLLTPLLALFGTMAVNRRMAFFSDALGHSALAGAGIGMLLGFSNLTITLVLFGLFWALLINRINRSGGASADTNISVFSSTGIALGLVLLSQNGNFSKYSSLLVGDVLAIDSNDLTWLLLSLLAGLVCWALIYNSLLLTAVNPQLAQSRGIRTRLVEDIFVCLVAISVMLSIRWVGVLLINALLILPAAAGRNISKTAPQHALFSVIISLLSGIIGLVAAFYLGSSVGAAVVLCAALFYALSLLLRRILNIAG